MAFDVRKIREDFPILEKPIREGKRLVYLDTAATAQKPRQVIGAMDEFYRRHNANVHRAIHQLSEEATEIYEEAHRAVAGFINAGSMEEVIFTKNATESLNLLAYTLVPRLKKGDEIVLTQMEHHSNLVPWQQLAKRQGTPIKFITLTSDHQLNKESVEKTITDKTKVVAVAHVSNTLGTINDVQEIAKMAHERHAWCVVDGAQSVPHLPIDAQKLGCDFLAFSGHKMYGPSGIGVLYGRKELLEEMPPFLFGGGMIRSVDWEGSAWNGLPWKFEAGTPPMAEAAGLLAAVTYLKGIGMGAIGKHEKELASYALKTLSSLKNVTLYGPRKNRAGVFSFNVKGVHAHDVAAILDAEGIAVRGGHHCTMPLMSVLGVPGTARASLGIYSTTEDIDALAAGIGKVQKVFG
ncbi:cysteine desulfurase [Candidatus Woesearchaeota archaeon]|nr:cysteine desulfurase [Candidatus Woesearchaeota archaeon]